MANETAATPAATQVRQLTLPEVSAHFAGQKKINGMLCEVDWMLVEALRQVATAIETGSTDATAIRAWLTHADQHSEKVANEDPPGCDPNNRTGGGI